MKSNALAIIRISLGILFITTWVDWSLALLTGFHFLPEFPQSTRGSGFVQSLQSIGYFWPLLRFTELLGGVLLLSRRYAPVGVLILLPVVINIVLLHFTVNPSLIPIAAFLLIAETMLLFSYRNLYKIFFNAKLPDTLVSAKTPNQ